MVLQYDFYADERNIHSSGVDASMGESYTYANPLRYFADAMRAIFLKGCTLADTWPDLACLLGIGTVTTSLAVLSYRKTS